MFQIPSPPSRKPWIALIALTASFGGIASAQDFTMMVTNSNPLGLGSFIPGDDELDLGIDTSAIKGDFGYGLGLYSEYNSNFFQVEDGAESEISGVLTPNIYYTSDPEGGAKFSITANYTGTLRRYYDNSDLDGYDQSGDVVFSAKGGKTTLDLFGRYSQVSGTDRLTGDFITGTVANGGLRASRLLGTRTTVSGGWSYAESDYSNSTSSGAQIYSTYVNTLWQASERLSFGPGLSYIVSKSDLSPTRDSVALRAEVRYKAAERIWLSASVGPEYSFNSGSGPSESSFSVTGEVTARYIINERWSWSNSVVSANVPSPDEANYSINNIAFISTLNRSLVRGSLTFGLDYNHSSYDAVGTVATDQGSEDNLALLVGYQHPLFTDRIGFNTTLRYTVNQGETDWDQVIVSAGLSVEF